VASAVYILCFLTSLTCAFLLLRRYAQTKVRLLLWSGLCFVGMALNNGLLFMDRIVFPDVNLIWIRTIPVFVGLALLLYGLIWEDE
jgi:hypothetical protein